jgi:succinate dehydrogenase/fumarate reductase flavoprotein subunit
MGKEKKLISRRNFLVAGGAVIAAGALSACAPKTTTETVVSTVTNTVTNTKTATSTVTQTAPTQTTTVTGAPVTTTKTATTTTTAPPQTVTSTVQVKPWLPAKWDYEYDIVCIGGGGASASAAIAATDLGAKCLILEKAPEKYQGGNTCVAGGEVYSHQNVDSAIQYMTALNGSFVVDPVYIKVWANKMKDNGNWMTTALGCPNVTARPWDEWPELPGHTDSGCWIVGPKGTDSGYGKQLWDLYYTNIVKRKIDMWFESPGKHLIQDPITKEILGVIAEKAGATVYIKAKKAVVLACGGFENNQQMHQDYLHRISGYPLGTPYNTGDGINMALEVNADLWHCGNQAGPGLNFVHPDLNFSVASSPGSRKNCIHVGADGNRFMNEAETARHGKVLRYGEWVSYPTPLPIHSIFDDTAFKSAALGTTLKATAGLGWNLIKGVYMWSTDNSVELTKGWIKKANTIKELAVLINKDPAILDAAVTKYNGFCTTGVDTEFGRPKANLLPIATAPFYAMELKPTFYNTQGGPRRNEKSEILNPDGKPIPRLYGGGELGSPYAHCYNGGMNLGDCMAFGRIAAENAVKLTAWS